MLSDKSHYLKLVRTFIEEDNMTLWIVNVGARKRYRSLHSYNTIPMFVLWSDEAVLRIASSEARLVISVSEARVWDPS